MKLKIIFIALAFILPTFFVHAEDGLTPCFDYYKFGSVQVDMAPVNKDALSGTNLVFNGNIRNTNSYPIVDGSVYIKIFRKAPQSNVQSNGWELVDQFFAQKDLDIDNKKQLPFSFTWKIPAYAVGGEYKAATYFVTQDRFNLSGLSFTDDITGTIIPFKITSEQTKTVVFDKDSVKVNDQKFLFTSFIPKVNLGDKVDVTFSLKNEHITSKNTQITYTTYSWDGLRSEKILNTKKETITLKANETKPLSYTITDTTYPVYYLTIESKTDDVKSIINVRFARTGVEEARLNFPSITTYPLQKGVETTMFSCFHNSGLGESIPNGKVVMTLTDGKGKQLDTYTWEGDITGKMMGIKKSFTPKKDYSHLILITDLYTDDKLIDSSRSYYECEKLNQELCALEANNAVGETSSTMMYVVIALAILVLLVAILAYHGHMKRKDDGVAALLFMSTLGLGMYQVGAGVVSAVIFDSAKEEEAVSLTYPTKNAQGMYIYDAEENDNALGLQASTDLNYLNTTKVVQVKQCGRSCRFVDREVTDTLEGSKGYIDVDNFNFQYVYGAEMRNAVTNEIIPEGAVIPTGTKVKFVPVDFDNHHIAWFLTGSTFDTPYAYWDNGGAIPSCQTLDKFARQRFIVGSIISYNGVEGDAIRTFKEFSQKPIFDINLNTYLPIVATKPSVSVALDPSTTANVTTNTDGTYTVNSAGIIKGVVTFAPTTAKAYFQYRMQNFLNIGIVPMLQNGDLVDIAPGQEDKVNAVPQGACQTLTNFQFPLDEKQIVLSADVGNPINKAPNTPGLTLTGTCMNAPTNIIVNPASPVDPDAGNTVTYEYQVDSGSGYGASQSITGTNGNITFTVAGSKKIKVRARDNGGLFSGWSQATEIYISNCATISVYCSDPVLKGSNWPEWTATVDNPSNSAYALSWSVPPGFTGVSSGFNDSVFTIQQTVSSNGEIKGPTVTATIGSDTDTKQCPTASRGGDSSNTISGSCKIESFNGLVPTWRGIINNGSSPYVRKWYKSGVEIVGATTNQYTFPRALYQGEKIDDISTIINARNGSTGEIFCDVARVSGPSINLILKDSPTSLTPTKTLVVRKNADAYANTISNAVTGCRPSKTKKGGISDDLIWGTADFDEYSNGVGVSKLTNYPLLTNEVGTFELRVTCNDGATPPKDLFSTSTLIVTEIPNFEEI